MFIIVIELAFDEENLAQTYFDIKDAPTTLPIIKPYLQLNFLI